jgi:HD-GYP domain-containing protein (c-di-GMP phosphodiesterase class II)
MAHLRVKKGKGAGKVYEIGDKSLIIGRENTVGIQMDDKAASREHAEIFKLGEMFFVRDLSSRNGTLVNGELIDEELLREGDIIQIGETEFAFEEKDAEAGEVQQDDSEDLLFDDSADLGSTMEFHLAEVERGKAEITKEGENLKTLYHIGKLLSSEVSSTRLLDDILDIILRKVDADHVYIFTKEKDTGKFKPVAKKADPIAGDVKISRTIIRKTINETRSILTNNAMSDKRFGSRDSIVMKKIRSVICTPLVTQHRVNGVLYISRNRPGDGFETEDLEFATAVGTMVGMALENLRARMEQHGLFIDTIKALISAGELRVPATKGHSERVSRIATNVAKQMKLPIKDVNNLRLAALLHDVGKVGLPVVMEESKLRDKESMRRDYIEKAEIILGNVSQLEFLIPAVRHQYENFDGTGIPEGLKGNKIPQFARIINAANAFDFITTQGGSKGDGLTTKDGIVALREDAGTIYDPEVVAALEFAANNGSLFEDDFSLSSS